MTEARWDALSPDVFHDAISLIAEGVTEVVGFEVCAISVVREDGYLEMVAVAGSEDARAQLLGHRTPVSEIQAEIDNADRWGKLRFVPHERMGIDQEELGWVPDIAVSDEPDAWHPLDLLLAPFHDEAGQLRGLMSIDVPLDGRRPGPDKREQLQKYAVQAGRAILTAYDRADLADQLRLAEAARQAVRQASSGTDVEAIFEVVRPALIRGFSASGMWIQLFGRDGDASETGTAGVFTSTGTRMHLPDHLAPLAEASARALWGAQQVVVLSPDHDLDSLLDRGEQAEILDFLDALGVHSVLFIPLGAGTECLGNLVLTRSADDRAWSDTERASALEIGHDLGRTLATVRTLARERRANEELRRLDRYKSEMIATVAHELKNPLAAVLGHLEMLDAVPELPPAVRTSLTAIERGGTRMAQLVEDLLTLSRVGDPDLQIAREPVDLQDLVNDVVDLVKVPAARKGIALEVVPPAAPVLAVGDAAELDRVLANLVSNAVKYSPEGRTVTLSLERVDGEAVFRCRDQGLGIAEEDRDRLFAEFFRGSNPTALAEPGTGLGLTIVQRIVAHHGGRVDVSSQVGVGSTFTVRLPAAA